MHFLLYLLMPVAASAASNGQPVVEVYLPPVLTTDMAQTFQRAQGVVKEAYSEIGVQVKWRSTASAPAGCTKDPLHWKIVVGFGTSSPAGAGKEALAFANPYLMEGPCVTLLMDRVEPAAKRNPRSAGYLLGHVLAHEIGHVLQGIARHSETGLMKAHWSLREIKMMPEDRLRFTEEDSAMILRTLANPLILRTVDGQSPRESTITIHLLAREGVGR